MPDVNTVWTGNFAANRAKIKQTFNCNAYSTRFRSDDQVIDLEIGADDIYQIFSATIMKIVLKA